MNYIKNFQKKHGIEDDGIIGKIETLPKMKEVWGLNDMELAHFLGQTAHESLNFQVGVENLNYSYEALLNVFKYDFDVNRDGVFSEIEKRTAKMLARKPEQIANFVYANQNGNGDVDTGDGWNFRGRGAIQLTGRKNYDLFSEFVKNRYIVECPCLVSEEYFFESAIYYFTENKIWKHCNEINTRSIKIVTRLINGGYNGLSDRTLKTHRYFEML